jgi:hypothetical protein
MLREEISSEPQSTIKPLKNFSGNPDDYDERLATGRIRTTDDDAMAE